ncbi:MAG: hypothetical protein AB7N76_23195 [Planctomycetota bacterium]
MRRLPSLTPRRRARLRRGTALIQVLALTFIAATVMAVVLTASQTQHQQARGSIENSRARLESRGAVHLAASYLSKDLAKGTPISPVANPSLWAGDGATNPYVMVLVGRGALIARDTTGTFYTPGSPGAVLDFDTGGAGTARDKLVNPGAVDFGLGGAPDFVVRVEYRTIAGSEFYYHVRTLAKASDAAYQTLSPTILSVQAALKPESPQPWEFGLAGLNQVQINGSGTFGLIDTNGVTETVIGTNGTISKN